MNAGNAKSLCLIDSSPPRVEDSSCAIFRLASSQPQYEFNAIFDALLKESNYLKMLLTLPDQLEHLNRLNTLFCVFETYESVQSSAHLT